MNLFRSVLFWLVLAVLGALLAQVLLQDPGYVLVRYRGTDYTTTVAAGVGLLLATLVVLVVAWKLLRLPFRAWKRHRERQARAKLTDGLVAYQRGDYARAELLLKQAAEHPTTDSSDTELLARTHAAHAAQARGDDAAATAHAEALGERHAAVTDPTGNVWWIATHLGEIDAEEERRRVEAVTKAGEEPEEVE